MLYLVLEEAMMWVTAPSRIELELDFELQSGPSLPE
jgi:hypothetical protein